MWNPFARHASKEMQQSAASSDQSALFSGPRPSPSNAEEPGSAVARSTSTIAEVKLIGPTAVATLTVTELSQENGAEQLADLLYELSDTGALHFVLDVQNVQYMDTACLGCLVQALNRLSARGGRIALVNPNHSVHYVFRLTRLDHVFSICSSVMAALEAVDQAQDEMTG